MRASIDTHKAQPWRVHTLAPDFELLDVWRFDLAERAIDLPSLLRSFWKAAAGIGDSWLGRARVRIGQLLGWDDHDFTRPIPGCVETSLAERLSPTDRSENRAGDDEPSPLAVARVKTVYRFDHEALYEVSNDTIHALLHVGIAGGAPELAIYIKSRGLGSRLYMAAIEPFRHAIVYPALVRRVERALAA